MRFSLLPVSAMSMLVCLAWQAPAFASSDAGIDDSGFFDSGDSQTSPCGNHHADFDTGMCGDSGGDATVVDATVPSDGAVKADGSVRRDGSLGSDATMGGDGASGDAASASDAGVGQDASGTGTTGVDSGFACSPDCNGVDSGGIDDGLGTADASDGGGGGKGGCSVQSTSDSGLPAGLGLGLFCAVVLGASRKRRSR